MFGPRDLYRPGETVILNGLLRDSDGKPLPEQPVKLDVLRPDGQVARTVVVQPENGLYRFNYPLDSSAQTGMWHIRANTGITSSACGISTSKILCLSVWR